MAEGPFIAIDWGTTNRRIWRIDGHRSGAALRDATGILAMSVDRYSDEISTIRHRFGNLPVLIAGMAGSDRGWAEARYVACPATLTALAGAVQAVAPDVYIVPGVRMSDGARPDVMRGEEVQFLGAIALGKANDDALLCQPGTHSKWARVSGHAVTGFATAMTGELFAILKHHALVGAAMRGDVTLGAAFLRGVERSGAGDLLTALFEGRPATILDAVSGEEVTAFVSGLLIGTDVRAQIHSDQQVLLIADDPLRRLYTAAIGAIGGRITAIDSDEAFVAGITELWKLLP